MKFVVNYFINFFDQNLPTLNGREIQNYLNEYQILLLFLGKNQKGYLFYYFQ